MKTSTRVIFCVALTILALAPGAFAQIGVAPFAFFPSGDVTDGRMLSFGCLGIDTFEESLSLRVAVPPDVDDFALSVFDGDSGGADGTGVQHWDLGTRQLVYRLYFDPLAVGSTDPADLVAEWFGNASNPLSDPGTDPDRQWTVDSATMPDNDWWNATVTVSDLAMSPSGNFFYHLVVSTDGDCTAGENLVSNLKFAASSPLTFLMAQFGFEAALRQIVGDGPIIYEGFELPLPSPTFFLDANTTYDGTFDLFLNLPENAVELELFDGDFDHGTSSLTGLPASVPLDPCTDTDDPDTANDYSNLPPALDATGAANEGVNSPGSPADDLNLDGFRRGEIGDANRRGCVRYELIDPNGKVYRNDNPSSNLEWEQFRIATSLADDPTLADYGPMVSSDGVTFVDTETLPAGIWQVRIVGLDMSNLNFWFLDGVCGVRDGGPACPPPVFVIGDTVFIDSDGDGIQDAGEPGIPGVVVNILRDPSMPPVASLVTGDTGNPIFAECQRNNTGLDEQGLYCFGVDVPGEFTVEIDASNFAPGGALASFISTTGGEQQTDTMTTDNLLDFDFGYQPTGSIGDRVWLDDGNGVQDAGEPGLVGVSVRLLDAGGSEITTTMTGADGAYVFDDLPTGDYTVEIVTSTLPAGVEVATFDLDGVLDDRTAVSLGVGEDRTDVDFGYRGTGALGDRVWLDDGDGVQEAGEPGLVGVTVRLLDAGGSELATTVTGADGLYGFGNLPAGDYTVEVVASTLPGGVVATFDADGDLNGVVDVSLGAGEVREDIDFGYRGTGSIGDRVWFDDGDGLQEAGEPGLEGVSVRLLDGGGQEIATAVTGVDGIYTFADLPAGDYSVEVVTSTLPAGVDVPTFDLDGGLDSRAASTLGAGENRDDVDFGYAVATFVLGDTVFFDAAGDGLQDAGDNGLQGVIVFLLDSAGEVVDATVTDANGNYAFVVAAGAYTVEIASANLAVPAAGGAIGDRVWLDADGDGNEGGSEPGLGNVVVRLFEAGADGAPGGGDDTLIATTSADLDGRYLFAGLAAGVYFTDVAEATLPAGLSLSGGSDPSATRMITADETFLDLDFGYSGAAGTALIGDFVWSDADGDGAQDAGEPGIGGVTLDLIDDGSVTVVATTTTAADGSYLFSGVAAGTYVIDVTDTAGVLAGYSLTTGSESETDPSAAVTVAAGDAFLNIDFGYNDPALHSVSDVVWFDADRDATFDAGESGLGGVTVSLVDSSGAVIATTTTVGDGSFSFTGVADGSYAIRIDDVAGVLADLLPTTAAAVAGRQQVEVAGADVAGINFGYVDSGALEGLFGSTIKDPIDDTERQTATVVDSDVLDLDFGYAPVGSLGDRLWLDDGDGLQEAGEPGLEGVTVRLLDAGGVEIATAITGADGIYGFANLAAGDYTVEVVAATLPPGLIATFDLDGTLDNRTAVTLGAGADRTDLDFGYGQDPATVAAIGDRVWLDDGDGVQEAGEPGIVGATVELFDAGGVLVATAVTGTDGFYLFDALAAGTYTVKVDRASLGAAVFQTFDLDGLASADAATVTVAGGEVRDDVDFGYAADRESCLEPALNGSVNHAVWLPGLSPDFVFVPVGRFVEAADGTAQITGTLVDLNDPARGFVVNVVLDGRTAATPAGSPKKELSSSSYVENGGPIDPATWIYYTNFSGSLVGTGQLAGAILQLSPQGAAFQVGVGANGKNLNFGASAWFSWTVTQQPSGQHLSDGVGDFNLDIVDCPDASICLPSLDFELGGNGHALTRGQIIDDEFANFGIHVTSSDPTNHPPMIFDSAHPTGGDYDLGTPHQAFGGPGVGSGGGPGQPGVNSVARGRVLILSEDGDASDPDDNFGGGTLIFTFDQPVFLASVDILDIDNAEAMGSLEAFDGSGVLVGSATMQPFGNNSYQTVPMAAAAVERLEVTFPKSGALAAITFCEEPSACLPNIDFELDAAGHGLSRGEIIDDEFASLGIQVSSDDPNHPPMIFDSAHPTGGDYDLGTPHQAFGGPGVGSGGGFGQPGANAVPRGNVLILSEDGDAYDPDDNYGGGTLIFAFDQPADVASVDILDIDNTEAMGTISAFDGSGSLIATAMMQPLGNNSYQTVPVGATGVRRLEVHFPRSGALAAITFCDDGGGSTGGGNDHGPEVLMVRDEFDTVAFDGNNGTQDWTSNWIENDPESGGVGPSYGAVRVKNNKLRLDDRPNTGGEPSAARAVDLSGGYTSASLSFEYKTTDGVDASDAVVVEVSSNGVDFSILETFTGIYGWSTGSRTYDISAFLSTTTTIRFRVTRYYGGSSEYFYVDNVQIEAFQ